MGSLPNSGQVVVPVFLRATQGLTVAVVKIDRMHIPYDFNSMAMLRGPLLHITTMNAIEASQSGHMEYPKGAAGLYDTPDFNLVRFIPSARDPSATCQNPQNVPQWVQGDFTTVTTAPEVRLIPTTGQAGGVIQIFTRGQWRNDDEEHFWSLQDYYSSDWENAIIFNTRVISKFKLRITADGTLVSNHRPRWDDISKIVAIQTIQDDVFWKQTFDHEWALYQVRFTPLNTPGYLQADEFLIPSDGANRSERFQALTEDEADRLQHTPWGNDGRYICGHLLYFRSGWPACPECQLPVEFVGTRRKYYVGRSIGEIDWALEARGLWRELDATNPENTPRVPDPDRHDRLRHSKAVETTNANLNKFRQHQRKWMDPEKRAARKQRNDVLQQHCVCCPSLACWPAAYPQC